MKTAIEASSFLFNLARISRRAVLLAALAAAGQMSFPVQAGDWYRWRGPDDNGISSETGWLAKWPDEGPKQLWKASVGTGFATVSVSNGRIFTMGNTNNTDSTFCFDAEKGTLIWQQSYPCKLDPHYYEGGPGVTPTVDGDLVYTDSKEGDLFCRKVSDGSIVWQKKLQTDDDVACTKPTWGFNASPFIEGDVLYLNAGQSGTALDKKTGKVIWASKGTDPAGYSTPVLFTMKGERDIALFAGKGLVIVRASDGKLLMSYPWKTEADINVAEPIVSDGKVFISSGYDVGCALLDITGTEPKEIYKNKTMRNQFNCCILWQGNLYGVDNGPGNNRSVLKCMAFDTGDVKWENNFGRGALQLVDGKLVIMRDGGQLRVVDANPKEFTQISSAQVLGGKCWTMPVLCNGKIYCRSAKGDLVCLSVANQ